MPFRDLTLALNFNALKDSICHEEGLLGDDESLIKDFERKNDCLFHAYWYVNKQIPTLTDILCCWLSESKSEQCKEQIN